MWRIAKRFRVHAAHHLAALPAGHKCAQPHGHSYDVELVLEGDRLDEHGWLMDYGDLSNSAKLVFADVLGVPPQNWDHGDWNTALAQPTAENLAYELYLRFAALIGNQYCRLAKVRVWEDPGETWAEWEP